MRHPGLLEAFMEGQGGHLGLNWTFFASLLPSQLSNLERVSMSPSAQSPGPVVPPHSLQKLTDCPRTTVRGGDLYTLPRGPEG